MSLAPGEVFAGFTIERELGAGGMGVVYLARHPRLPRHVALKLLRTDLGADTSFVSRFRREAETVARLDHPNIVSIDDSGADGGQLWISMRFIDGTTASEALAGHPNGLDPARVVHIVERVASALDFAHRHRVVHRDVKPANILLTADPDDGDERVYLTDFGVAKAMDEIEAQATALTTAGGVVATLDYAAPEQIEGKPLDGRCDVYALGCVLYKLLTGVIPFPGETLAAKVYARLHNAPPVPSDRVPDLPAGFDEVVSKALALDPDDRYQTGKALAVAARAALNTAPRGSTSTVRIDPTDPDRTQSLMPGPGHPANPPTRQISPSDPGTPPPGSATGPSAGYSTSDSLPSDVAHLLGHGPYRAGPGPSGISRTRTIRRRSWLAVGGVALVAAVVVGVVMLQPAPVAGTAGVGPSGHSTPASSGGSSSSAASSGPSRASSGSSSSSVAASTPPVAGLSGSTPLGPGVIVASRQYQGKWALYPIDATTGKVGPAITRKPAESPQNPLISTQRGSLIYLQGGGTSGDRNTIRTSAVNGDGDRQLFATPTACVSISRPAWDQADPQRLAINCSTADGPTLLEIVTLDGKLVTTLDTHLRTVDDLSFSPDGTQLVYWGSTGARAGDGGLYIQATDGKSKPRSLTPADGHDADCDFSPDGKQVVFRRVDASDPTHPHIAVVGADGTGLRTLAAVGQGPVWSPDGKQIAYKNDATRPDGTKKAEIFVVNATGTSTPRELATDDAGTVGGSPIWGPR
ncbi:protein kinase domain-containing protein [Nakamurella panacisegetis]|nr:protein kinase [Nakamurella panacisegetis]